MKELDVTRVTVVDETGRVYERFDLESIHQSIQDDGKTLKVFINLEKEMKMKESITVIGIQHNNEERELTFEYNDNVIEAHWAPAYAGEPRKDRFLFAIDWEGNFEDAVRRMLELWGAPSKP